MDRIASLYCKRFKSVRGAQICHHVTCGCGGRSRPAALGPDRRTQAFTALIGVLALLAVLPPLRADDLGVRVPDGFHVQLYADDDLAHDIYSLTLDSFGRVVVSGAGYVKILLDSNADGIADTAKTFAKGPQTGAQGMYFVGRDLLCAGDGGLIRYRDRDGDDRADGSPDVFLRVNAGGEHDLHAIRKGPDGWWYAIAGNLAGVDETFVTLDTSPVSKPNAGTLLRLSPDLTKGEVIAHGFRNAYDFDFGSGGDLFTFDSDGERDVSLPWYRPTRVFHVLPGANHGWFSRSWKRPGWFFDMPPEVAEFGRGSPTGVVCYRHTQFPEQYDHALFVLDWTYGRVMALPLTSQGSTWQTEPVTFMTAVGQHGFAPTDAAVGPDGSLYVSVGGRGTRGGVYRISYGEGNFGSQDASQFTGTGPDELNVNACLRAPQPLSSWSRRNWEPVATKLTSEPFIRAALDRSRATTERIRAIEILTEKFNGLDGDLVTGLQGDPDPRIRARAVWSIGRVHPATPDARQIALFLQDSDPHVVRHALEVLLGVTPATFEELIGPLGAQLGHSDRFVRQTAMRALVRTPPQSFRKLAEVGFRSGWNAAIPVAAAYSLRNPGYAPYTVDIALRILKADRPFELKVEAARLLQLGLGGPVPWERGSLPCV